MKISVIVVNYNTKGYLKKLLESLKPALKGIASEVWVVDNNSSDKSPQMVKKDFSWVKLIRSKKNLGFSKANNQAIKRSKGEYILLLNSDTLVNPNSIKLTLKFAQKNPKAGLVTCRVELESGQIDPASHRGFPTPWAAFCYFSGLEKLFPQSRLFSQYHQGWKDLNTPHQIDSPSGCFFLIKREVISQVGLLDEDFFMYGEDLDFALRVKKAGWQVWYYSGAKITHFKKRSGRANKSKQERVKATRHFFRTMALFYKKHYLKNTFKSLGWLIGFIIWLLEKLKILLIWLE